MGLKYQRSWKISSLDQPEEIKINHYQVEVDRPTKQGRLIEVDRSTKEVNRATSYLLEIFADVDISLCG
jgi:hypothetical protein